MAEWYRELSRKKGLGAEESSRYNQLMSYSRFISLYESVGGSSTHYAHLPSCA